MKGFDGALLASGGLDSTTLWYQAREEGQRLVPLFLNYGQHCRAQEHAALHRVLPESAVGDIVTVDISSVYAGSQSRLINEADLWREDVEPDDLYLPYRNLLFMATGAAWAQDHGLSMVCAAFINSNHAIEIDCSSGFFDQLAAMLTNYGGVRVNLPFRDLEKRDVLKIALDIGVPVGLTYSCQVSSEVPCGACPNCVERLTALEEIAEQWE